MNACTRKIPRGKKIAPRSIFGFKIKRIWLKVLKYWDSTNSPLEILNLSSEIVGGIFKPFWKNDIFEKITENYFCSSQKCRVERYFVLDFWRLLRRSATLKASINNSDQFSRNHWKSLRLYYFKMPDKTLNWSWETLLYEYRKIGYNQLHRTFWFYSL